MTSLFAKHPWGLDNILNFKKALADRHFKIKMMVMEQCHLILKISRFSLIKNVYEFLSRLETNFVEKSVILRVTDIHFDSSVI